MKAQSIDRLALTRAKFGAKMYGDSQLIRNTTEKVTAYALTADRRH